MCQRSRKDVRKAAHCPLHPEQSRDRTSLRPAGRLALEQRLARVVAQTSESAVSRVPKPARRPPIQRAQYARAPPIGTSAIQQVGKPALRGRLTLAHRLARVVAQTAESPVVAQTSESAVSRVPKPPRRPPIQRARHAHAPPIGKPAIQQTRKSALRGMTMP